MKLSHIRKPSKSAAFELVRQLKMTGELSESDVDSLINYFAPALPKKVKTVEQWVGKACNPKDIREFCHFIFVKDRVAIASDGARIHWGATELSEGVYDPTTLATVTTVRSPNFSSVMDLMKSAGVEIATLEKGITDGARPTRYRRISDVSGVSEKFLMDAANGLESTFVEIKENKIIGKSEFGNFVVMGLKI